jgi:ubiquinone/menaquinone biosynthesis C-methylase UbiE
MSRAEPNFDRVAAIYRWAEYAALGPLLQRTRTHLIPHLTGSRRALVLGDGDGRFLEQLLLENPHCEALAIDTSAAMLEHLRRRCMRSVPRAADRLRTLQQTALTIDAPPGTDLVVTHFFLDCLSQSDVDALVHRLTPQLTSGALWVVSDFAIPSNPVLRPIASLYVRALYLAFGALTGLRIRHLPDPQSALSRAGLTRLQHTASLGGLLYTELWRRE